MLATKFRFPSPGMPSWATDLTGVSLGQELTGQRRETINSSPETTVGSPPVFKVQGTGEKCHKWGKRWLYGSKRRQSTAMTDRK